MFHKLGTVAPNYVIRLEHCLTADLLHSAQVRLQKRFLVRSLYFWEVSEVVNSVQELSEAPDKIFGVQLLEHSGELFEDVRAEHVDLLGLAHLLQQVPVKNKQVVPRSLFLVRGALR